MRQRLLESGPRPARGAHGPCATAARRSWNRRVEGSAAGALDRRPSRRPRRLVDRAEPAVLPRSARAARLPRDQRGRGRARRDDLLPVGAGSIDRPARGADDGRRAVRPLRGRPASPRARGGVARGRRRAGRLAAARPAPRSRAGRRNTRTSWGITRCSSTTRTGSSSRSSTSHDTQPERSTMETRAAQAPIADERRAPADARQRRDRILIVIAIAVVVAIAISSAD